MNIIYHNYTIADIIQRLGIKNPVKKHFSIRLIQYTSIKAMLLGNYKQLKYMHSNIHT